jgi:hypothetical protein
VPADLAGQILEHAAELVGVLGRKVTAETPRYRRGKLAGLMRTPALLDGRQCLDAARMTRFGYRYLSVSG